MIDSIIKDVFGFHPYTIVPLDKGLTNRNYKIHIAHKDYVLRLPWPDSARIVNRHHEKQVQESAYELDVPCVFFDVTTGVKITAFIDDVYEYDACPFLDKIERCARLMKQLHTQVAPPFHFQPFATLATYASHVSKPWYDLSMYDDLLLQAKHIQNTPVLCHNDFVSGNILLGDTRDYLIDYEYGAANDPLFDVMSFLSENKIVDPSMRARFYHVYFEGQSIPYAQLYIWEVFQNVLWCHWAMMMYESRQNDIYKDIAKDKYDALQAMELAKLNI